MVKKLTKQQIAQNQRKQAYMKSLGYNVPTNGSWGPYQEKLWTKLTTRGKTYDATISGLAHSLWDRATGNTTENFNPVAEDSVQTYDAKNIDLEKTKRSQNKVVNALAGTYAPLATVVSAPLAATTAVASPIATTVAIGGGALGGTIVDKVSEGFTGKNFGTSVALHTPLTPGLGETLNPGYTAGGAYATKRMLNAVYSNITPFGYGDVGPNNQAISKLTKKQEITNAIKDFLLPRKIDTNNPKWMQNINPKLVNSAQLRFRDDAWRLATRQKPKATTIKGKPQTLYFENPDGTYGYNLDYIQYYTNNATPRLYVSSRYPQLGGDNLASNAGYMRIEAEPECNRLVHTQEGKPVLYQGKEQYYLGKPEVTIHDVWDLQPFKNLYSTGRNLSPKFAKYAQTHQNNPAVKYIRDFEGLRAIGGKPFTLHQTIPAGKIGLYSTDFNVPK